MELAEFSVGRSIHQPGWRWSTHTKAHVGTDRCEFRHVGVLFSGTMGVELRDGTRAEISRGQVFDIPPGHDAWTVGDAPIVSVEWAGVHEWLLPAHGERVLATLLITDLVDSTAHAARVGDQQWRRILTAHEEVTRAVLAATRGTEISTTGDGFVAMFDGPAHAIQAAQGIRSRLAAMELRVRQGIHVGEVELSGGNIKGLAVHEAARITAAADGGEILVSEVTKALAVGSGFTFEPRGTFRLKGLQGEYPLFALVMAA